MRESSNYEIGVVIENSEEFLKAAKEFVDKRLQP